jgi:hypothetical protein
MTNRTSKQNFKTAIIIFFVTTGRRGHRGTLVPYKGGVIGEPWFPIKEGS